MNKYIYTITIFLILITLMLITNIKTEKTNKYYIEQYKNIQKEKTSLIEEIRELKQENKALKSVIDTYNIPNNLDTRFE